MRSHIHFTIVKIYVDIYHSVMCNNSYQHDILMYKYEYTLHIVCYKAKYAKQVILLYQF